MESKDKFEKRWNSLLYNHLWLKYIFEYGIAFFASVFSALIFSFGVNVFLDPAVLGNGTEVIPTMVSGGSSGLAQVINLIFKLNNVTVPNKPSLIFSICYLLINIPLIVIAFKGIGKRFGIFTLINVGLVFLFTNLFHFQILSEVALYIHEHGGMLARAFFAGMCTGLSSAIAYKIDASAGGFDIISYYISIKKSTLAGKYSVYINGIIIGAFAIMTSIDQNNWAIGISGIWFSAVYLLTVMLVVDVINIRNKKAQLQIITSKKELPQLLLANIPHGATLVNAKGAYSGRDRYIIYMVVSTTEIKHAVKIIKELDNESFVNVTSLQQVYGNFHMKPIK